MGITSGVITNPYSNSGDYLVIYKLPLEGKIAPIAADANMQQRIDEMGDFVKNHDTISEYSEVLVRRLIEKVTIFEKNIVVDFKSGVNIAIEI